METANIFTRLRSLAIKVEKETCLYKERCYKPVEERAVNDRSVDKMLKELQYDVHKVKDEGKKQIKKQEELNSFKGILLACENLVSVNQRQACSLEEHLVQYGYQRPMPKSVEKVKKNNVSSKDKENEDISTDFLTEEDTKQTSGPGTPPNMEEEVRDIDRTPKEEDFGLCISRVNMHLKDAMPDSQRKILPSSLRKILPATENDGIINTRRSPLLETTVICRNPGDLKWEDWTFQVGQTGYCMPSQQALGKQEKPRPESTEPHSPNLTSWFFKEEHKPPAQPVVFLKQGETFTPPSPECQTTEMLSVLPQEPKRLVESMDNPEPQEPEQCYSDERNVTPELQPSVLSEKSAMLEIDMNQMVTPVHKRGPTHLAAFLQDDGTPRTPELTMSISNFSVQPKAGRISPQLSTTGSESSQITTKLQPVIDQTSSLDSPQRSNRFIAPITSDEHKELVAKLRKKLSLEQVNRWIHILDDYLMTKPLDEKHLSPEDISSLQSRYAWLKASLIMLVTFNRLEKFESENGEVFYLPFMRRQIDFS